MILNFVKAHFISNVNPNCYFLSLIVFFFGGGGSWTSDNSWFKSIFHSSEIIDFFLSIFVMKQHLLPFMVDLNLIFILILNSHFKIFSFVETLWLQDGRIFCYNWRHVVFKWEMGGDSRQARAYCTSQSHH